LEVDIDYQLEIQNNLEETKNKLNPKLHNIYKELQKKVKYTFDNELSFNFDKNISFFDKMGLNFKNKILKHRELINSISQKRNQIIHYNDNSSEVSFLDIQNYILNIKEYLTDCDKIIVNNNFLPLKTTTSSSQNP